MIWERKLVFLIVLTVLTGMLVTAEVLKVKASGNISINPDGSIDPPTTLIFTADNVTYSFTDSISDSILVKRNNIIVDGNRNVLQGSGSGYGFRLFDVENVTIKNTNINGFTHGVYLDSASRSMVIENNITNNNFNGIFLEQSFNNTLSRNIISNNLMQGVKLHSSSYNVLSENNITDSQYGVILHLSSNNTLHGNMVENNEYNFDVWGHDLGHFTHSIDISNLADNKPVYYLVSQKNFLVGPATHSEVGYLTLINCANATVEGLSLTNNGQGLLLAYTNNSRIVNNNVSNNSFGVWFEYSFNNSIQGSQITNNRYSVWLGTSSDNTVSGNNITDSAYGIWPYQSFNNTISGNTLENNRYGIWFDSSFENTFSQNHVSKNEFGAWFCGSSNNTLSENNITNNLYGFQLGYDPSFNNTFEGNSIIDNAVGVSFLASSGNRFFHNNFVNNTNQVNSYASLNFWDDGVPSGGNYWSNYASVDLGHDGIGDVAHALDVNNTDRYPLMGTFSSFATSLGCNVDVISNSTIDNFHYFQSNNTIKMQVSNTTTNQVYGFCRVRIPHAMMNETYQVTVDGVEPHYVNYTLYDDGENRWMYFSYEHSQREVVIIPEFLWVSMLPLLMVATSSLLIVSRRKDSNRLR